MGCKAPQALVRAWSAMALALAVSGCNSTSTQETGYFVFGTLVQVQVRETDPRTAETAFGELQSRFQHMHQDWHAWEPGMLSDINQAFANGQPGSADPYLLDLVRRSKELEEASLGHFNPAIGGLIDMWGFHTSRFPVFTPPPSEERIQAWLEQAPSMADVSIRDGRLYSSNPGVRLDFGAIAKGYAVDIALDLLAKHGLRQALVNAGGDLRARGRPGLPWRVGIRDPAKDVLAVLEIEGDEAVFTSGTDQRFKTHEGKRYPHVLSPLTGRAVEGLQSATVIAAEGIVADAAATALLVAGPERWREIARRMGISQALVIDDSGQVFVTPDMNRRLQWAPGAAARISIVQ